MRKSRILWVALLLVLESLGVGYAQAPWSETLYVGGEVNTGDLCVQVCSPAVKDDDKPPPWFPTDKPDENVPDGFAGWPYEVDKNVAWGEAQLIDQHTIQVSIHEAYPCYYNHFDFWVTNCGTIPALIQKVKFGPKADPPELTANGVVRFCFDDDEEPDFEVKWGNNWESQIDPSDPGTDLNLSFGVHVLQDIPQHDSFTFTIEVVAIQWNKK